MNIQRRKFVALAVTSLVTAIPTTTSALTVFDPWNYVQTTISAVQAVTAQVTRLSQLRTQILDNMKLFAGPAIAGLSEELTKVKALYNSARSLQTTLTGAANDFNNLKSLFGAGNYKNFGEMLTDIGRRSAAGEAVAKNLYKNAENAMKTVEQAYNAHSSLVDNATSVNGITEAAQSTTAAVGIMIQQQNAMLSLMSAEQVRSSVDVTEATAKKKRDEEFMANYKKSVQDATNAMNGRIGTKP